MVVYDASEQHRLVSIMPVDSQLRNGLWDCNGTWVVTFKTAASQLRSDFIIGLYFNLQLNYD